MVRFSTFVANSWWFTKIIVMIFCAIIAFLGWFFFNTSTSYVPILSTFIASDGISKCISSQIILKIPSISSIFITRAYLVIFSIIFTLVCLQIFVFLIITPLFIPLFILALVLVWLIHFVLLIIRRRVFSIHVFVVSVS